MHIFSSHFSPKMPINTSKSLPFSHQTPTISPSLSLNTKICSSDPLPLLIVGFALMAHLVHTQDSSADYVNAHNAARSAVGVPPLAWDDTVAQFAQDYANQRKGDCQLVHSGGGCRYGEDLAWSSGDQMTGANAVEMWVNEKENYDYNSNSCIGGQQCLHYTQVVWRDTARVGCAKVRCDNGGTFIGCNYDPPGNYVGQRPY